jgi:hypothetical protein
MVKHGSLLLLFVAMTSCTTVSDQPRLTSTEVIRLADAEARRRGYDLRIYQAPRPRFNYVQKDNTWAVFYDEKPVNGMAHIGYDFIVHIDDRTKELWLIPGR